MTKLLPIGRILFSLAMLGLSVLCFINKDFIIGRPPQVAMIPFAYLFALVVIVACIAIMITIKGYEAALSIAACILLFSITRHLFSAMADWLNAYKCFALLGGSLIVAASFNDKGKAIFIWSGTILLSIFFVACGYAHIKFYDFVQNFIPNYIPFHGFFAYFTAACLFAGGIGILIPATRKWAALFSGLMLAGWFILLHIPRFVTNMNDASDRMGLFESLAFSGFFFVLASLSDKKINSGL